MRKRDKNKILRENADPNGPYGTRKHKDRTKYERKQKYKIKFEDQ